MSALAGKRVLNTRAIEQQAALDQLLIERSAIPVSFPCIAIEPLESTTELDAELRHAAAGGYTWVLITSVNTSQVLEARLQALDLKLVARVGVVGETTAAAVEAWLGRAVDFIPESQHGVALAEHLAITPGDHVLIPASSKTRSDVADAIRKRGAHPHVVAAYRTVTANGGWLTAERKFDAVAFASPSAVEGFIWRLRSAAIGQAEMIDSVIGCIGPTTFEAARVAGFSKAIQASSYSLEGLVDALEQHYSTLAEREASSTP
ncbi:MAG: uroporphyrinogen-III synthase [Thermomicrobiales bacterium]